MYIIYCTYIFSISLLKFNVYLEVLEGVLYSNWSNLIKLMRVYWKDDSYSFSGEIIQWSKVPVYPDCQHFDLLQYLGSDREWLSGL